VRKPAANAADDFAPQTWPRGVDEKGRPSGERPMGPRLSASILSSPRDNYFCNQAVAVEVCRRLIVLLGCTDQGLVDNNAMAWNAAISGSVLAEPWAFNQSILANQRFLACLSRVSLL
jgi:hypothetical protein